jgi:DnaJ-class molecular chaperone
MLKYLLIVLLAGALAYVVRDNMAKTEQINAVEEENAALNTEIQELRTRMGPTAASVPRAGEAAASTPSAPAGMTVQNISCRICSGTGKVRKKGLSGSVRPTPCTVCAGRGSKDLQLPAGASACSACGGAGRVAEAGAMSGVGRCDTCKGLGYTR